MGRDASATYPIFNCWLEVATDKSAKQTVTGVAFGEGTEVEIHSPTSTPTEADIKRWTENRWIDAPITSFGYMTVKGGLAKAFAKRYQLTMHMPPPNPPEQGYTFVKGVYERGYLAPQIPPPKLPVGGPWYLVMDWKSFAASGWPTLMISQLY